MANNLYEYYTQQGKSLPSSDDDDNFLGKGVGAGGYIKLKL